LISTIGDFEAPGTSGVPIKFGALGTLNDAEFNKLAELTLTNPLPSEGKSVAMLAVEVGFVDMIDFDKVASQVYTSCSSGQGSAGSSALPSVTGQQSHVH